MPFRQPLIHRRRQQKPGLPVGGTEVAHAWHPSSLRIDVAIPVRTPAGGVNIPIARGILVRLRQLSLNCLAVDSSSCSTAASNPRIPSAKGYTNPPKD
jgi:hypothetical protein